MENERTLDNEESSQVEETTENNDSNDDSDDKDAVIAQLKEEKEQLTEERDNYKKGMLSAKNKRTIEKEKKPEVDSQLVNKALRRVAEKEAIAEILDPDSPAYIPECVDNKQWNQIISYIPTGADRETKTGVKRALKIAVAAWKADTGFVEPENKKEDKASEVGALGEKTGGDKSEGGKPKSTLNIPKKNDIDTWFPKGSEE